MCLQHLLHFHKAPAAPRFERTQRERLCLWEDEKVREDTAEVIQTVESRAHAVGVL